MSDVDYLIVGLGNPGSKYADTRHNVGFIVIDQIARSWREQLNGEKWNAFYCRLNRWNSRLTLVKPNTFMNRSGQAVAEFARFFKVPEKNILIIHDDLDMHPGRLKLVKGGGAGGHNGIRSISQFLGTNDYFRLKVGIGRPGKGDVHPDFPVDKYVLSSMEQIEIDLLQERIPHIEEGLRLFITEGHARAMSLVNSMK